MNQLQTISLLISDEANKVCRQAASPMPLHKLDRLFDLFSLMMNSYGLEYVLDEKRIANIRQSILNHQPQPVGWFEQEKKPVYLKNKLLHDLIVGGTAKKCKVEPATRHIHAEILNSLYNKGRGNREYDEDIPQYLQLFGPGLDGYIDLLKSLREGDICPTVETEYELAKLEDRHSNRVFSPELWKTAKSSDGNYLPRFVWNRDQGLYGVSAVELQTADDFTHPVQPLYFDHNGVACFKPNRLIRSKVSLSYIIECFDKCMRRLRVIMNNRSGTQLTKHKEIYALVKQCHDVSQLLQLKGLSFIEYKKYFDIFHTCLLKGLDNPSEAVNDIFESVFLHFHRSKKAMIAMEESKLHGL